MLPISGTFFPSLIVPVIPPPLLTTEIEHVTSGLCRLNSASELDLELTFVLLCPGIEQDVRSLRDLIEANFRCNTAHSHQDLSVLCTEKDLVVKAMPNLAEVQITYKVHMSVTSKSEVRELNVILFGKELSISLTQDSMSQNCATDAEVAKFMVPVSKSSPMAKQACRFQPISPPQLPQRPHSSSPLKKKRKNARDETDLVLFSKNEILKLKNKILDAEIQWDAGEKLKNLQNDYKELEIKYGVLEAKNKEQSIEIRRIYEIHEQLLSSYETIWNQNEELLRKNESLIKENEFLRVQDFLVN